MPYSRDKPSMIALITAANEPIAPASHAPLPPSGLVPQGMYCVFTIRASDAVRAVDDFEFANAGLESRGRDILQAGAKLAGGPLDADASGRNRTRTTCAEAGGDTVSVALHDMHALRRKTELLRDELRIS